MGCKNLFTGVIVFFVITVKAQIPKIYYYQKASSVEQLAAKELQRYIYLRTGILPMKIAVSPSFILSQNSILIANVSEISQSYLYKLINGKNPAHDDYQLKSIGKRRLVICGGSDIAVLYGAYKFLESTGIGFEINGDIIPDNKVHKITLDYFNKTYSPSFALRGIQPFHDFPEGPDWWNKDDYNAIIAQLPKMGMNFIGFHTYPENKPFGGWAKAEPLVWIGTKNEVNEDGTVKKAYPALHNNTGDSTWAYYPKRTSDFHFGAAQLFETDIYGADYMKNVSKWPHTDSENIKIFNQFGSLLSDAFTFAKNLGVKTCIGTEVPLVVPEQVRQNMLRYDQLKSDSIKKLLYEGLFTRIKRTHPLDYYWFWTPESWTWEGEAKDAVEQTEHDLLTAIAAAKTVDAPFTLATCGWVLGPARNRSEFDKMLPQSMPFGVINRQQGYTPVEPSFAKITDRPKWEISWLEDDPALTTPQFWAGRTLKDAADAYKFGCTGFMGIHWRTENLSPTFMALADAGWNAKNYKRKLADSVRDYPVDDLYVKWARLQFGSKAAAKAAKIFTKLDGAPLYVPGKNTITAHFPRSSEWGNRGPGKIVVDILPWNIIQKEYDFINVFRKLKPLVAGGGSKQRYLYWYNTFMYAKTQARIGCLLGEMRIHAKRLSQHVDHGKDVETLIGLRQQAADEWATMITYLLQTVNSTGEMGTLANLEQHSLGSLRLLNAQDSIITAATGKVAPAIKFNNNYQGLARLVITTSRTLLNDGDDLAFKVRVLSKHHIGPVIIHWRSLGSTIFQSKSINYSASNVFNAELSNREFSNKSFEYYITTKTGTTNLRYPTESNVEQSVVVW